MNSPPTLIDTIRSGQLREQVEFSFEKWGYTVYRHPWLVIIVTLAFTSALLSQLPKLVIDTSLEGFLHEDNPTRKHYDEFREQFGRDDKMFIAVETDEVFDLVFLEKLRDFHQRIEEKLPFTVEVESLVNARQTVGVGDTLVVGDFMEEWPQNDEDLARLKAQALANPVYVNTFISPDSRMAVVVVENEVYVTGDEGDLLDGFEDMDDPVEVSDTEAEYQLLSGEDNTLVFNVANEIFAEFEGPGFEIYPMAGPYTTAMFMNVISTDMQKFTGLAILATAVLLSLLFRRVVMVVLPLMVSILAMLCCFAVMAMMGISVSFSTQVVPPFLLAVGVGNAVHLFTVFFQAINRGEGKEASLAYALRHSGLAIVMTGLTTAGGLLSFISSNMKPITEFGMVTPIGVLFALIFSLVLLPALMAVFPINTKKREERNDSPVTRWLIRCSIFSTRHPKKVVAIWAVAVVLGLFYASKIKFSYHSYNGLPPDHELRISLEKIDLKLSGAGPLEIVLDTGEENGVKDPDFLNRLDEIYRFAEEFETEDGLRIGKIISVLDINKEIHRALHNNQQEYYTVPQDKALVAQELLLFENSGVDDLEKMVDSSFQKARLTIMTPFIDAVDYPPISNAIEAKVEEVFGDTVKVEITGLMNLVLSIFRELMYSLGKSYLLAIAIITPLMIILVGSLRTGLVSMIPNLSPLIITLGVMGAVGIDFTSITLLTGSVALGLVVDDTIHFMHNFQRYHKQGNSVEEAVKQTLVTTGHALLITTAVLSTAFLLFMFHSVSEWAHFGFITSFCLVVAFFADANLAPALMVLLNREESEQLGGGNNTVAAEKTVNCIQCEESIVAQV